MSMRNGQTPAGTEVAVAGAAVNYVGVTVIVAGDLVYTDSQGNVTSLTGANAPPAGLTINCAIQKVTTIGGTAIGYKA